MKRIFYSWQSDILAAACRSIIEDAIVSAISQLKSNDATLELCIDRDTLGVAGSPDIGETILSKIEGAHAFISDVTIVGKVAGRPMLNPNVLFELGYAVKTLGWERIVLVQNITFGPPTDLPFDIRQRRVVTFESAETVQPGERANERKRLASSLERCLSSIPLSSPSNSNILEIKLTRTLTGGKTPGGLVKYNLNVAVVNGSKQRIADWTLIVQIPVGLCVSPRSMGIHDDRNSTRELDQFVVDGSQFSPLLPNNHRAYAFECALPDDFEDDHIFATVLVSDEVDAHATAKFSNL